MALINLDLHYITLFWQLKFWAVFGRVFGSFWAENRPSNLATLNGSLSPIHTARWSRKIARKLPECLLCERKHVPGLIPGLIPGWDLVTLPGSVPERTLCEQKPDQCRKGCVVVMTHFIVWLFYGCFEGRSTFTRRKICKLEWSSDQGAPHYPRWSWNHSPV